MIPKTRVFGFHSRYLISLMLSLSYSADSLLEYAVTELQAYGSRSDLSRGSSVIGESEFRQTGSAKSIASGVGRILSSLIIYKVNNKYLLLGVTFVEVFVSLGTHLLFKAYEFRGLAIAQVLSEVLQNCRYPLCYNILSRWSTLSQMTFLSGIFEVCNSCTRIAVLQTMDALIATENTAGRVYLCIYLTIGLKTLFIVLWFFLGAADPYSSMIISEAERNEIQKCFPRKLKVEWATVVPWCKIFKCPAIYACAIGEIGNFWYFEYEFFGDFDPLLSPELKSSRFFFFTYIFMVALCLVCAIVIDFLIKINFSTTNNIRKTATTITAWGCAVSILLYGHTLTSRSNIIWIISYYIFKIPNYQYHQALNVHSISPTYCGFIYCYVSAVAYFSRVGIPHVKTYMEQYSPENYHYFVGFLLFFTNMVMIMISDLHLRDFDSYGTVPWKDESITSYP